MNARYALPRERDCTLGARSVDMNYELKIIPDTRIAFFCWSGPITLEDRKKNVETIAQFCQDNGVDQLIVDTCQQINETSTIQMFDFSTHIPKAMRGVRIAVVRHPSDEETQFGENVAANRGAQSRSFDTLEEARRWLEGKDKNTQQEDSGVM
jgi:hypothetical protein